MSQFEPVERIGLAFKQPWLYLLLLVAAIAMALTLNTIGEIDVQDYGAVCNNVTDDTTSINNALGAAGAMTPPAPVRIKGGKKCLILGSVSIPNGVDFHGGGMDSTILHVTAATTATGGILMLSGAGGDSNYSGKIRELQIEFDQPDSTLRSAMTQYVPAIYIENKSNWEVDHVRISRAWDGIKIRGFNGTAAGGAAARITNSCIGQFNDAINIDGMSDILVADGVEAHWVCGHMTANQQAAYGTGGWGMQLGRMDGLLLSNALFFKTGIRFYHSANGIPSGSFTNVSVDGVAVGPALQIEAGNFTVASSFFNTTGNGTKGIEALGDGFTFYFSATTFLVDGPGMIVGVDFSPTSAALSSSYLSFSGGSFFTVGKNIPAITDAGTMASTLVVDGVQFLVDGNCALQTVPLVNVTNANTKVVVTSNTIQNCTGGTTATFANISNDIRGAIIGNIGLGWRLTAPAAPVNLKVVGNTFPAP